MQPLSGSQRPDLLRALMNMSLVLRLPRKMHLCRSSSNVPRLPSFLDMLQDPHVLLMFDKVHNPLRLPRETTSERPKVVQTPSRVFNILTSKYASRHNGVDFLYISISKSGPRMVCLVHVDFEMCFAPQRRALFRHLNFQKWSGAEVFLCILTWKCASRHNGVQFFIARSAPAALASLLFDPLEPQIIGKNTVFRDFPAFLRTCIFFLLTLSLLWSSLFCSSLLYSSAPPLLFICPYCRKFGF